MTQPAGKPPITIRLEVLIPTELGTGVQVLPPATPLPRANPLAITCTHPSPNSTTFARPLAGLGYTHMMCAYGTAGGKRHVALRVYPQGTTPGDQPPQDDPLLRIALVDSQSKWQIDELPIENLNTTNKILGVWSEMDGGYSPESPVSFNVSANALTYCQLYPPQTAPPLPAADHSRLPDRWLFQLADCANARCQNCDCLNGEWLLIRDGPSQFRWHRALEQSFTDPRRRAFWRLTFNEADGFWYLDCVETLEQLPGSWISFRRHESAWNPSGPNTMHRSSDNGYCHVPDAVTLYPA